ncbi:MAG TPA: hypothetical protein VHZ95_05730 [Polyangiales bacterium]|nr:hypothetical protein [Polyangiales bacterium]
MRGRARRLGWMLIAATLFGCESHSDLVCENSGACSQGGDSDWIDGCKREVQILESEAKAAQCHGQFDRYYACADDHYTCRGDTASFPTCDDEKSALEHCLADHDSDSACGMLAARRSSCAPAANGGEANDEDAGTGLSSACDLNRQCQARCFLDNAQSVCAPSIDELTAFSDCAERCLP